MILGAAQTAIVNKSDTDAYQAPADEYLENGWQIVNNDPYR